MVLCDGTWKLRKASSHWTLTNSGDFAEWAHTSVWWIHCLCQSCLPRTRNPIDTDMNIKGVSFSNDSHIAPYKIIYVLLGGLAIIVGFSVLIWLPDSPVHAHFLDQEERIAALERVRNDQGGVANKKIKRKQILEAFTDIRTWLIVLTTMMSTYVPCNFFHT